MARRVFFSFHYHRDIWRVNQIRNLPNIIDTAVAGFIDVSLWEEAKIKGDATVQKMIDDALIGTTVTVVMIGEKSANRKFINYEITQSIARGNGIVGVQIHHLKNHFGDTDSAGAIPAKLISGSYPVYKYVDSTELATWIEAAAKAAGK